MSNTKFTIEPNSQSLSIERAFNAPIEKVFDAFVDIEKVKKWWGGAYKTEIEKYEPRSGGSWRMVQSDGNGEYAFHGVFHEVAKDERIIWTFEFEGLPEPGHALMETMHFTEQDGKTIIKTNSVFQSVEDRDGMVASGMQEGSDAAYNALAELVEA